MRELIKILMSINVCSCLFWFFLIIKQVTMTDSLSPYISYAAYVIFFFFLCWLNLIFLSKFSKDRMDKGTIKKVAIYENKHNFYFLFFIILTTLLNSTLSPIIFYFIFVCLCYYVYYENIMFFCPVYTLFGYCVYELFLENKTVYLLTKTTIISAKETCFQNIFRLNDRMFIELKPSKILDT